MSRKKKYIELFAGCGGLSLGLESAGFELEFANELSPMAANTFAYNLLGEDLNENKINASKSIIHVDDLEETKTADWSTKKLVVGDVIKLVDILSSNKRLTKRLKGIDLVSGGPPCQGFSMAGKRKERDPKNSLPYAFVDFVNLVKPKIVILENVEGILRSFKSDGGTKKPWLEIAKAFADIGYAPLCFMLNSKYFGIPQKRSRFLLIGIRADLRNRVVNKLQKNNSIHASSLYQYAFDLCDKSSEFIRSYTGKEDGILTEIIDMRTYNDIGILKHNFILSNLFPGLAKNSYSAKDAVDDLKTNGKIASRKNPFVFPSTKGTVYSKGLSDDFSKYIKHPEGSKKGIYNHELRSHRDHVKLRYSLIQEASSMKNGHKKDFEKWIRGKNNNSDIVNSMWKTINKKKMYMTEYGLNTFDTFREKLELVKSKKHMQRALIAKNEAPTQVTCPDDICHYDKNQPRVLSVREMARIQSFPDEFVFRSKVTTGGPRRRIEVPQYTQVGNAVPPILGRVMGQLVNEIIK